MVGAAGGDGAHDVVEAQGVQLLLVEGQVFHAPAHLFAGHDLAFAEAFLRAAHGFDAQHLDDHATGVQHRAHFVLGTRALTLVVHVLEDVLDHLGLLSRAIERQCVVTLGTFAHVAHIGFSTGPPHAIHLLAWVTRRLGFLQGGGVHHTPAPQQHVVGAALAHLQPGGLLFDARGSHRQHLQLEAVHLGAFLHQRDGLFAERTVVVHEGDFLALELVHAAQALANVLQQNVGARPIAAHQREVPLECHAVLRNRQAIAQRHQRDLVGRGFFGQGEGDTGRLRIEHGDARAALEALVAFHTTVGRIAGFALFKGDLHSVDAAIAGVDHLDVVLLAVGPGRAVGRVGAGAVGQEREELLLGLCESAGAQRRCTGGHGGCGNHKFRKLHGCLL